MLLPFFFIRVEISLVRTRQRIVDNSPDLARPRARAINSTV